VAAGPVSRILSAVAGRTVIPLGHALLRGSSDLPGGCGAPSRHAFQLSPEGLRQKSLPIWSCSVWGLPCPAHYCDGGALLPHLFTLTWALRPGRYVFCGTFRRTIPPVKARGPSRTLSGTLLCGVRTFLCLATATVRSGCQQVHYSAGRSSGPRFSHPASLGARRKV